ncbi:MAG: hypothetical protein ACTSXC_01145 [Candidatus Freyarchaeota archaeon]
MDEINEFSEKIYSITQGVKPKMLKTIDEFVEATRLRGSIVDGPGAGGMGKSRV